MQYTTMTVSAVMVWFAFRVEISWSFRAPALNLDLLDFSRRGVTSAKFYNRDPFEFDVLVDRDVDLGLSSPIRVSMRDVSVRRFR